MSDDLILKSKKPSFEIPLKSFGEVVWNRLQELNSDSICIIDAKNDRKIKLKDFISHANSIAVALINRGITKSDRIGCFGNNTPEYAVFLFASYFLGITIVPLSPSFREFELKKEIEESGVTIVFTSVANANRFDWIQYDSSQNGINNHKVKLIVVFDGCYKDYLPFEQLLKEGENQRLSRIPYFNIDLKNDIFLMVWSSGSTGLPKSTMISHYAFVASLTEYLKSNQLNDLIVSGQFTFGHIGGSLFFPLWLCYGATVVLYDDLDFESVLKAVEKYKINLLPIFPKSLLQLVEEFWDKYELSSVKMIFTGATHFPESKAQVILNKNIIFRKLYGMTEYMPITEFPTIDDTEYIPGSNGRVSQNTELKIVDLTTGQSLGPNIDGEICVRGTKMFSGYLINEIATKETIDSEGWVHTGDIGHYDKNERIFITDRLKELIKFENLPVYPAEIECFLLSHECVSDVAVVGVKHETQSQWPRAYVKLKEGKNVNEEELKTFVAETLSDKSRLRAGVIFVDNIPRLGVGKINRNYFKQLVKNEIIGNN